MECFVYLLFLLFTLPSHSSILHFNKCTFQRYHMRIQELAVWLASPTWTAVHIRHHTRSLRSHRHCHTCPIPLNTTVLVKLKCDCFCHVEVNFIRQGRRLLGPWPPPVCLCRQYSCSPLLLAVAIYTLMQSPWRSLSNIWRGPANSGKGNITYSEKLKLLITRETRKSAKKGLFLG